MNTRRIALAALLLITIGALILTQRRKADAPASPAAVSSLIASSEREFSRLPSRFTRLSDEQEIAAGNQMLQMMTKSDSPTTESYLQEVGAKVARGAHRKLPYRFHYMSDPNFVNAFALPGGHIIVGQGLLQLMDSEDELAAVLGHEIAHVDLYHCAERLQVEAAARRIPLGMVFEIPALLFQAGYHKDQELEADRDGLPLAIAAGYSAGGALRFEEKFQRLYERYVKGHRAASGPVEEILSGGVGVLIDYFRSHPPPRERLAQFHRLIDDNHWDATKPEKDLRIGWVFWTDRAKREYEKHRYDLAAAWAERSLKVEPRQPATLRVLGDSRMRLGDFPAAAAAYRKFLEIDPQLFTIVQAYADALGATHNPGAALAEFRSWSAATSLVQVRTEIAGFAAMAGDLAPSQGMIAQAREGSEVWTKADLLRLAIWLYRAGRFEAAENLLDYLNPRRASARRASNALGWVLFEKGDAEEASRTFENDAEGFAVRAVADWKLLNLDQALVDYQGVAATEPEWRNPKWIAGFYSPAVASAIAEITHAEDNLRRKLKTRGELPEVMAILGPATQLSEIEAALRLDPHSAEAWFRHGIVAAKEASFAVATADFERVIRFDPKRYDAYLQLDLLLARQGQFARMASLWSAYIQLVPDDGRGWLARAQDHARVGDLSAAASDAGEACERKNEEGCRMQKEYRDKVKQ